MATSEATEHDAPAPAPAVAGDTRWDLAEEFLRGSGIEIGALHLAMRLPQEVTVRYVDRMSVEDLRTHYPELGALDLAPVHVVDDGEQLHTVHSESVDFIVANHFLEHCQDPVRTITTHLSKLGPAGVLFYAVPDKRFTFDFRRPRTPLQHVIDDHEHGPERSRSQHYLEWASLVHEGTGPPSDSQARAYARQLEAEDYSIHFHVWTQSDLIALMLHIQDRDRSFEIEAVRRCGIENIVVLRKEGQSPARAASTHAPPTPVAAAPLAPAPAASATRDRIPLASLRARLDDGSRAAHWSIDPDGTNGRGLVQAAATRYTVPVVATTNALRFEARARLLPHDWRDGRRGVWASVAAVNVEGRAHELWADALSSASAGGCESGVPVSCAIPPRTVALVLGIDPPGIRDPGSAARAAWMDAVIIDPVARADGPLANVPRATALPPILAGRPLLSVLTPVHDPDPAMLRDAVESVRAQTFADWELRLVDDGCRDPEIIHALRRYAAIDSRIHIVRRDRAGGIADATNAALAEARGEYIALLDHDDRLPPNALELVARTIAADPAVDVLYSDEAILADGRIANQSIKPGWSPESLCSLMYTCHLGVYRRALAREAGGLRPEFDGSQDYDLILRLTERTNRVAHIPAQLYHWRAHAASTAGGEEAKPYAYLAQPRAIAQHLRRLGVNADVQLGALPGMHRLVHRVDPGLEVAIATVAESADEIAVAARSWCEQGHANWRLVCASPVRGHDKLRRALTDIGVSEDRLELVPTTHPGMPGLEAAATAAARSGADRLVLMQAPCAGLTHDWLTTLVGYCSMPGVAVAGALVLAPDGRVADGGLAFPEGIALPLNHGSDGAGARSVAMNVSAVSGVIGVSGNVFAELGGLDPDWGRLVLAELCVRAAERGLRTVSVPDARMQLVAGDMSLNDLGALWRLRHRWVTTFAGDRYYNSHFRTDRGDFMPRVRL